MGNDWQLYRTRFLVKAVRLNRRMKFVDALGHEHRGQKGDYLVESCDGIRRIAQQKFFEDVYVNMGPATDPFQSNASVTSTDGFVSEPGRKKIVENHRPKHESRRLIA